MTDKKQHLEITHKSLENGFDRELHIIGINHSVVLRSNHPKETLKYLSNIGLYLLELAKKIDEGDK